MSAQKLRIKESEAVTLISLVVTIVLLLILLGVSIATLRGENGLLTQVDKAKKQTEISEEKEIIDISVIQAMGMNDRGNLIEVEFQETLDRNSKEENKASIIDSNIERFTVKFASKRYYEVDKNGNIKYIENVTGEKTLTVQCANSKNEVLAEYKYTILQDNYSKFAPTVEGYEASEEKIEGKIEKDITIKVMYYLICDNDITLVFTGLDADGDITTNESEIVSYMVGDGIGSSSGCGLVSNLTCKAIVVIPSVYKNKNVTVLGQRAFQNISQIVDIRLPDSIQIIEPYALGGLLIENIVLPKRLQTMTWAFFGSQNLKKVIFTGESGNANARSSLNAFYGTNNFSEIEIDENNTNFKVIDNILYSIDEKKLLKVPNAKSGEIIIGDSVEGIAKWAFNQCKIESVTIGKNVNSIGDRAFQSCNNLNTIIINSPTITASLSADTSCGWLLTNTNINTIYIKNDIDSIGSYLTSNYIEATSDKTGYVKYVKNQV